MMQQVDTFTAGWATGWTPDERLTVSQWADKHRKLGSKSSAEPGDWRTDRAPYAREPMDSLSVYDPTEIVVMMGAHRLEKPKPAIIDRLRGAPRARPDDGRAADGRYGEASE